MLAPSAGEPLRRIWQFPGNRRREPADGSTITRARHRPSIISLSLKEPPKHTSRI
jgi:hypothetical protein